MARKRSRWVLTGGAAILVAAGLAAAFWPQTVLVDLGEVERRPLAVTIDAEGRTVVHDTYVVSAPVAGRLLRVTLHPGDEVLARATVVAEMRPTNPGALDIRSREQARAAVTAAEAALRVAQAELNRAMANEELARADLDRARKLAETGTASQATLERAEQAERASRASLDTARAAISMRVAELDNAQAQLISFDRPEGANETVPANEESIPLYSPIDGRVLRVIQQNETTLPDGAPIVEVGDIENDLEIEVELLSTDAVQVNPGDRVIVRDWGGSADLDGVVDRVGPVGVTKFSALGVEEQRVLTRIRFVSPHEARTSLGHGYSVEVLIVVWEEDDVLAAPSSALFRDGEDWAAFVVEDGKAVLRRVEPGQRNATHVQIASGLDAGDAVILYPPAGLTSGMRVEERRID